MVKRTFMILTHRTTGYGDFSLNDMPGSGGRIDIAARSITAALAVSHGVRKDTNVVIYLSRPKGMYIRVDGDTVKYLNPDERSTGALLRNAMVRYWKHSDRDKGREFRASPGIYVGERPLEEYLQSLLPGEIIYLHEDGDDIRDAAFQSEQVTFILSDHMNPTPHEESLIGKYSSMTLSLGPVVEQTNHCISILHNHLDRSMGAGNEELQNG